MLDSPDCSLCGSHAAITLFETHDRLLKIPGTYRYLRCTSCGLIYLNPRPTWEKRQLHYGEAYRGYLRLETEKSPYQQLSMKYGLAKRYRILKRYTSAGRLLDIGCGGGDYLNWVGQQPGWQAFGLERNMRIAKSAQKRYQMPIMIGDIHDTGLQAGCFDVVTLWAVLEHLEHPVQGLRECYRMLRPGGLLVIQTIAQDSWGEKLFGSNWIGYDAPRILYLFSRQTLGDLLAQSGFEDVQMRCYFHDFYPYLWSWRNYCLARGVSVQRMNRLESVARSWIFRALSYPFFFMQTLAGKDSFVLTIARKV